MRPLPALVLLVVLSACGAGTMEAPTAPQVAALPLFPGETPAIRAKIDRWADHYDIPRTLVHRAVQRESDYRPEARNGPYWGILQILPATARSMGFRGRPRDLLDADTGLKYSLRYLRGAWMISGGDERAAIMHYARGYWHAAKARGMLTRSGIDGRLWRQVDAGAPLPPLDASGRELVVPPCEERAGVALALQGPRCADG